MLNPQLTRSVRAELVRTAGRGALWSVLVPTAILAPTAISFLIAFVAERFAAIPGQQYVQTVATSNAAYWVVTITVVLSAVAAAYGQSSQYRHGTMAYVGLALPQRWVAMIGTWLFYGVVGAAASVLALVLVLVGLPIVSGLVYGEVSIVDPVGLRLLWAVPVYAFFAAGLGVGVGTLIRTPAAAVGAILFWAYVIESAVGFLPGGYSAQRFMPFLNGVYGTGQDIVLTPPWGPDAGLAFGCAAFTCVFIISLKRSDTT